MLFTPCQCFTLFAVALLGHKGGVRNAIPAWFICVALYALAVLLFYKTTSMGQVALLDARENIVLARQMAEGTLPATPHYRAPLWPALLSLGAGLSDADLLTVGQLFNLLLHLAATWALYQASLGLWGKRMGSVVAAVIYGVYPVTLYFVGDLLDTSAALSCFTLGLWPLVLIMRLPHSLQPTVAPRPFLWGSLVALAWSVAGLMRPHYAVLGAALLVVVFLLALARRVNFRAFFGVLAATVMVWGAFVGLEYWRTGQLYVTPQQGGYNLWAANRASGLYYAQSIEVTNLPEGYNPALAEAEILYRQATHNTKGPVSASQLDSFYRQRFAARWEAAPLDVLRNYAVRLYAFFNNHEGYNNKTYAFQKLQQPLLAINPLGFLLISLLGLFVLLNYRPKPWGVAVVVAFVVAYALAAAWFYPSDRFRITLVPLVVLLVGGLPSAFFQLMARWRSLRVSHLIAGAGLLAAWWLFFGLPLWGVGRTDTTAADKLLLAQAALKNGNDAQALHWSQKATQADPRSQQASEVLITAQYNAAIKSPQHTLDSNFLNAQLRTITALKNPSDEILYIRGYYLWLLSADRCDWHNLVNGNSPTQANNALAALMLTGPLEAGEVATLAQSDRAERPLVLILAEASLGSREALELLSTYSGSPVAAQTAATDFKKLFDRQPLAPIK